MLRWLQGGICAASDRKGTPTQIHSLLWSITRSKQNIPVQIQSSNHKVQTMCCYPLKLLVW